MPIALQFARPDIMPMQANTFAFYAADRDQSFSVPNCATCRTGWITFSTRLSPAAFGRKTSDG